jgi:hypothetical protein
MIQRTIRGRLDPDFPLRLDAIYLFGANLDIADDPSFEAGELFAGMQRLEYADDSEVLLREPNDGAERRHFHLCLCVPCLSGAKQVTGERTASARNHEGGLCDVRRTRHGGQAGYGVP